MDKFMTYYLMKIQIYYILMENYLMEMLYKYNKKNNNKKNSNKKNSNKKNSSKKNNNKENNNK
jgi:hypothetical protein